MLTVLDTLTVAYPHTLGFLGFEAHHKASPYSRSEHLRIRLSEDGITSIELTRVFVGILRCQVGQSRDSSLVECLQDTYFGFFQVVFS